MRAVGRSIALLLRGGVALQALLEGGAVDAEDAGGAQVVVALVVAPGLYQKGAALAEGPGDGADPAMLQAGPGTGKEPVLRQKLPEEHLTGIQYLNFVADIYGVSESDRDERIKKYADAFEMTPRLNDLIGSCSHGMKQKIALISALIHQPKILLLDEPFVGLDPKAAHTLKGFFRELCDNGSAIFFSTHVLEVAEKLCNKIAIIKNGKLIAAGEMDKVKGDDSLETLFLELTDNA